MLAVTVPVDLQEISLHFPRAHRTYLLAWDPFGCLCARKEEAIRRTAWTRNWLSQLDLGAIVHAFCNQSPLWIWLKLEESHQHRHRWLVSTQHTLEIQRESSAQIQRVLFKPNLRQLCFSRACLEWKIPRISGGDRFLVQIENKIMWYARAQQFST